MGFSVCICIPPAESCMEKSTKIRTTNNGIMSLEDIFNLTGANLEDELLTITPLTGGKWYDLNQPILVDTLDGPKNATSVWLNGNTNYIDVEMEDGEILKLTHHHKLLVKKSDGSTEWKMAINLEVGDDIVKVK
jgi:intein/homing endonuclease